MGMRGELNIGQIARERYNHDAVLIGQTTDHGTVTAASDWDGPAERKWVRPGLPDSYEALFHTTDLNRFMLLWRDGETVTESLREPRLERAIGVIYLPETERMSHYFRTRLPNQFDASSILTRHVPWSRWSGTRNGRKAKYRRPSPLRCNYDEGDTRKNRRASGRCAGRPGDT
jgi:erythromycin esterase-like protein